MADLDLVAHLRADSQRFLDVLRGAGAGARVPCCPDWDADDLLWHLTEVQWFWGTIVAERRQAPPEDDERPPRPTSREGAVALMAEQTARLAEALETTDPATPVWMWSDDKTAGYVRRRQAHEALIHRLDAEQTTGQVTPLDPVLASDGVHEVLDMMYGGAPSWGSFTSTGPQLLVRTTDTGLEVPVVLGRFRGTDPDDGTSYDDDELSVRAADPDEAPVATVSGTAADLDAWLWHRDDGSSVRREGDPEALRSLAAVLSQPID